jgi:ABC-type multidrug transport system fused ATPase/permease subunit
MSRVGLDIARELTEAMHRKLQALPMSYFDRQQTGRLMARMTSDVGSLLVFLNGGSLQLASDLVLSAGIAAVLTALEWRLALASLVVLPLFGLNHRLFAARLGERAGDVRARLDSIYDLLSERIPAVRVVRSAVGEEAELAELDRRIDDHRAASWAAMKLGSLQAAEAGLLSGLGTLAVLAPGVVLVARGRLTPGELVAFLALAAQLFAPMTRLSGLGPMLAATGVAIDRMAEVLDEPGPAPTPARPAEAPLARPNGGLSFRGVSFTYPNSRKVVLEGIDLDIEPGMKLGILGASGSGKSTLLALAPRLYELDEGWGSILLDGRDIRSLDLADLRRSVMLVPQKAVLFDGTIRSNLTYAAPHATAAQLHRVLEAADLTGTIASLPRGLETRVGQRGEALSGGQRQRVALARALLAEPAVLLLDDCTSALDAETEARIQAALADLLRGRTHVVASHRATSIAGADRIVVLQSSRIAECGGHHGLMSLGRPDAAH